MKMQLFAGAALAAGLVLAAAAPSYATALVMGTGWQYDQVDSAGIPSELSPFTVTLAPGQSAQFSISDGFAHGDTYTIVLNGVLTLTSQLGVTATPFDNNLGPAAGFFAADWLDPTFSHFALQFGPGSYSFVVSGDCGGGCAAGFGYRLDSLGVPEPAAWALMLAGFGLVGATLRRDSRRALAA